MATAKKQFAPAATVDLQETRCTCGCGETTPGPRQSRESIGLTWAFGVADTR